MTYPSNYYLKNRFYHNYKHLDRMFEELRNTLDLVKYNIDINLIPVLTYAITYHDIYKCRFLDV